MTFNEFKDSLNHSPPTNIDNLLIALWFDGKGNWNKSHKIIQDIEGKDAAWIHAYLHRKEGDSGNASYWYSRAEKPFTNKTLNEEWEEIVKVMLEKIK